MPKAELKRPKGRDGHYHVCAHCGEFHTGTGLYCPNCKTKAGREKIDQENEAIKKERESRNN